MSETMRMWVEVSFNIVYLIVVWGLVIAMWRRRHLVAPEDRRPAELIMWAFTLLALGDTGHVGFRVLAYALGDLGTTFTVLGYEVGLVGLGALSTAITVTFFYVLMLELWRVRFDRSYDWFGYLLLAAAGVRLLLMALPANQWNNVVPSQPWSTLRNLPLMVQGLGVAYLILRDARAAGDRTFQWIGAMIVVSYACYVPVIFFVQRAPIVGMLMIPKTLAYVAIAVLAYRDMFAGTKSPPITVGST
ncbi:MAG: hypothetical protein MAG451_00526 [Anaerolineales bacterium]|nr:hypothetical protein [Anaerolineales bacterium]